MDNTVNHMRYEIKVENRVKDKNNFFIKRNIAFLFSKKKIYSWRHTFFKISKNLNASAFFFFIFIFFTKEDTEKYRYALAKASNAALLKLTD